MIGSGPFVIVHCSFVDEAETRNLPLFPAARYTSNLSSDSRSFSWSTIVTIPPMIATIALVLQDQRRFLFISILNDYKTELLLFLFPLLRFNSQKTR
jgi:hypothetical protein